MKKLSEVIKLVGVTRRTLQEYNKMDLLKPTSKTEAGYWLYDDAAIERLFLIQAFVEIGYGRKEIKAMLDNPQTNYEKEIDEALTRLKEKRKKLDGMIKLVDTYRIIIKFPNTAKNALANVDLMKLYEEKSYMEQIHNGVDALSDFNDLETELSDLPDKEKLYLEKFAIILAQIAALALFKDKAPNSQIVLQYIHGMYESFIGLMEEIVDEKIPEDEKYSEDAFELIEEIVFKNYIEDEEYYKVYIEQLGNDGVKFIKDAIKVYKEHMQKKYGPKDE